jgi:hypothetical protein
MKTPEPQKKHISVLPVTQDKYGPNSVLGHVQYHHTDHPKLTELGDNVLDAGANHGDHSPEAGKALTELAKAHQALHSADGPGSPTHYHHTHEDKNLPPEGKISSLRTLSDLFEEVAL